MYTAVYCELGMAITLWGKTSTETKMSSFWRNFHHWLHWKLSFWQLPVQPVMNISSKWRLFRFSVLGRLTPRSLLPHFQIFPANSRTFIVSWCIFATDFVHSITVYDKNLHDTPLYWFKVFSVTIMEYLGQNTAQQNRGVKRPHA